MARVFKRAMSACAVLAFACIGLGSAPGHASAAPSGYEVYPTPHEVRYADGEQTLRGEVVTVVEDGIDADTEARLEEALALKGTSRLDAEAIPTSKGATALLVGVKGSGGAVDKRVGELVANGRLSFPDDLFSKTDSYLLASLPSDGTGPDQVIVLGRDTDAAYYGLTTLYQILQQIDGAKMRAFTACDYADVISRGFIEGYYGNPWSTEDRIELMRWGGYYKLNAYFYAPKDDPKHNKNWREPYTEQELKDLIEPLAKAGNASKVRFVYALHPFMSNPITSANYDEAFPVMKEKFLQVIDSGVRQIAILADDATNQGDQLYTKLLKDTTDWLHELQQMKNADGTPKYPGLKDTLIFCPERYMGNGEGWYRNLPDTVQVINTGGRVWGKIDSAFANTFKSTSGVAPFMWINWPCSDNDKDALHMGGHNNFLGADLKPGQVKGVVINPMQQSEPSKQGIFMNADFTWNLWESTAHADALWERSFSYIDHNSGADTKGSNALRELSRHMTRMYGGGATWENGESAAIKEELAAFRAALSTGSVTAQDCDEMIEIFTELQAHAKNYRVNAGTERMAAQMDPFLSAWDDLTVAAIEGLSAIKADLAGDASNLLAHYTAAAAAFDAANGHGYRYVDHTEYARVGKAHITPMVNALMADISVRATIAADPEATVRTFVTSRADVPTGKPSSVFDGDLSTGVTYANPNSITADTYVGMKQNKPFDLTRFTITYDTGHPNGIINTAKLQVLRYDGEKREVWEDVAGKTVSNSTALSVDFAEMDEKGVYGVRLIATADNAKEGSLTINELEVNKADAPAEGPVLGTAVAEGMVVASNADASSKSLANVTDDSVTTFTHFRRVNDESNPERDYLPVGAAIRVNFTAPEQIDSIYFKQAPRTGDEGNGGDGVKVGKIQYLPAGAPASSADGWVDAATVDGAAEYRVKLEAPVAAQAIRVVNDEATKSWWKVFSLRASLGEGPGEPAATPVVTTNMNPYDNNAIGRVIDGDESTKFWSNAPVAPGQWIMYSFGESRAIDTVRMLQDNGDRFLAADVSYTTDANPNAERGSWTKIGFMGGDPDQTIAFDAVEATAIKIQATRANDKWLKVFEIEAYERHAHSADNIRATFKGDVPLTARVGRGQAVAAGRSVTLPNMGDAVAIDLGGVRREVAVAHAPQVQNAELVWSQNALEWKAFDGSGKVPARYVGYRSTQAGATLDLDGFALTYLESLDPRVVSSDLPGDQTLNAAKVFDGDVKSVTKSSGHPTQGNVILFDLGQERTITSLEYYVPETSLDFIRNAVIEVASRADAPAGEWTKVVDINGDNQELSGAGVDNIAKEYAALTHSSAYPGNMMASSPEGTSVSARYLRIRFTKTFTGRWVEIGELRINGGERVSAYAGNDFETSSVEQAGKLPGNMIDGDMNTTWAPQGDEAGDITYNVSEPVRADGKPIQGVRIVSRGVPSGATVTANVYTGEDASVTARVPLGSITQNSQEFRFAPAATRSAVGFRAVKSIEIAWGKSAAPQIAEIYLLADAPAVQEADIEGLRGKIDAANGMSKDAWTTASRQKLDAAVKAAEDALKNTETMTPAAVETLARQIDIAMSSPVIKYAAEQLEQLKGMVDGAHTDASRYTAQSWAAYQDALAEARKALEDPDNISQATGEALARALSDAQAGLTPSTVAADRAVQALEDARAIYGGGSYTASSCGVYESALAELEGLVKTGEKSPAKLGEAMGKLAEASRALVDVSALEAARAEFDKTNAAAYTPESFAAYRQAFDASTPLLQSATAEEVAAAVEALRSARAGLKAHDIEALIAECEKLAKGDYTEASWNALGTALAAAKAGKGGPDAPELAQDLAHARAVLVNVVALNGAIARADAIDSSRFTPESLAKLADAVASGRAAQLAGSAEDVEQARLAIIDALDGLVVNSGGNGGVGGGNDGNGGVGSGGSTDGAGATGGSGGNGAAGGLPSTGDGSMLPAIAAGATGVAAMLAGAAVHLRRRQARGCRGDRSR